MLSLLRWATAAAVLLAGAGALGLAWLAFRAPAPGSEPGSRYLSDLPARRALQGWRVLQRDRSVSGAPMEMDGRVYLKGLGTHAPSRLQFDIPEGAIEFRARVGLDRAARGAGSVAIRILRDGEPVLERARLRGEAPPLDIAVPVAGARSIELIAEDDGDGRRSDHVDWALARFRMR